MDVSQLKKLTIQIFAYFVMFDATRSASCSFSDKNKEKRSGWKQNLKKHKIPQLFL